MTDSALTTLTARKIIILRALFVGDLLCATPAFTALRRRFPDAEISLIGLPWTQDLVDRSPTLDRLLPSPGFAGIPEVPYDPARTAAFFAAQQAAGYDLALQLQGSGSNSNAIVAALGARHSIGFGRSPDPRLSATVPWIESENEVLRCLRPLQLLGVETPDTTLDFPLLPTDMRRAQALLAGLPLTPGPIVGLHAGAKDPRRRWPAARFAALGDALATRFQARIVLTGGPGDQPLGAAVRAAMHVPALDLTGRTDLGAAAAVISRLDLLVTNDTGASHLAAATRTPSVVLFGRERPDRWAPLDRARHTVIDAATIDGAVRDRDTAIFALPLDVVLAACGGRLEQSPGEWSPLTPPARAGGESAGAV